MQTIKATIEEFFEVDDWKYEEVRENILRAGIQGESSDYNLFYDCEEDSQQLILTGVKAKAIPEQYRPKAAELLTRANYNLKIGSYGMDFSDGEFRFRIGVDVEDGELSVTMVRNYTAITCKMLEEMYPCLMKLIYGSANVEDLYEEWKKK